MAKLPSLLNISPESFADVKWMPRLLGPVNLFMQSVVAAFNKQLTIEDNFAGKVMSAVLDGTMPMKLAWPLGAHPMLVVVGQVARVDGVSFTAADTVGIQWSFNQASQLQIDSVTGITPSASIRYRLTLLCLTG